MCIVGQTFLKGIHIGAIEFSRYFNSVCKLRIVGQQEAKAEIYLTADAFVCKIFAILRPKCRGNFKVESGNAFVDSFQMQEIKLFFKNEIIMSMKESLT